MRRRDFIAALGGAIVWPLAARAQQTGKTYRVGLLAPGAVAGLLFVLGACKPPAATGPLPAKVTGDCNIAQFAPINPGPPLTADNTLTGGTILAPSFEVPANVRVTLKDDLTVVSLGDITVAGIIQPGNRLPGDPSLNILLISLKGNINVWKGGIVGGNIAAQGTSVTDNGLWAYASAGHGAHGGWVKMVAEFGSIDITGRVLGNVGGVGGEAAADSTLATTPAIPNWLWRLPWAGSAAAYGGDAGDGGDIYLCARESIRLLTQPPGGGGLVAAGSGSRGGKATAKSEDSSAYAKAGSQTLGRGTGGMVYVDAVKGTGPVPVRIDAVAGILAGHGNQPHPAEASGNSRAAGATAQGGNGGPGGTVIFGDAVVFNAGAIEGGLGGHGGAAKAEGGEGVPGRGANNGGNGGNAKAEGGAGARAGPAPRYLDGNVTPWAIALGLLRAPGSGGPAEATGGDGGNAGPAGQLGGPSGTGTAKGGLGLAPPPFVPPAAEQSGPNAAANNQGAQGTTAQQPGNP